MEPHNWIEHNKIDQLLGLESIETILDIPALQNDDSVPLTKVHEYAVAKGGQVRDLDKLDLFLAPRRLIYLECKHGHVFTRRAENFSKWCYTCETVKKLTCADPSIQVLSSSEEVIYVCGKGHRFTMMSKYADKGCPTCQLTKELSARGLLITVAPDSQYRGPHSILKFKCASLYHEGECKNTACKKVRDMGGIYIKCYGTKTCSTEFLASPYGILNDDQVTKCHHHYPVLDRAAIYTITILETYFGVPFNDHFPGYGVTAYNKKLHLACIHMLDKGATNKYNDVQEYCKQEGIALGLLTGKKAKPSSIMTYLASLIHKRGIRDASADTIAKTMNTAWNERYRSKLIPNSNKYN